MEEETKKLLEDNLALNKENNRILLKLYNIQRWAQITRVIYWFVIIGISVGAFYFIQPFLSSLAGAYGIDTSSFGNSFK
jgi:hypothetical protein